MKKPLTTNAPKFLTHTISPIGGVGTFAKRKIIENR